MPTETHEPLQDEPATFAQTLGRPARFQFVSNMGRAFLLFAHQLIVARLFGAAALGLFTLATSAAQVAGMLSHLGGDYLVLRGGTRRAGELAPSAAFRIATGPAAIASLASSVVLLILASCTGVFGTEARVPEAVALVTPTVVAFSSTALVGALLQATGALRRYTLVQTVLEPLFRLAVLFALVLFSTSWAVALWSYTISTLLTLLIGLVFVRSAVQSPLQASDWVEGLRALRYSVPVMLSFALQFATMFVSVAIVTRVASAEAAGVFGAALRLAMLSLWAQVAFSAPFLPLVAKALERDRQQLQITYQRMVRFVMLVNVPLLATLFVGRNAFMALFGDTFLIGSAALAWMLLGQLVNTATAAIEALLPLGGRATLGLLNNFFQLAANALLAWWLVPKFGIAGAGVAVAASVIVTNGLRAHQVRRRWQITPLSTGLILLLGCGVAAVLTWEVALRHVALEGGAIGGIAEAMLVGIVVFVLCLGLTNSEDRAILRQIVTGVRNSAAERP